MLRADNLTTLMCRFSRNPGALTSRTPQDHVGLFRGYFALPYYPMILFAETEESLMKLYERRSVPGQVTNLEQC
jgi:hypothetical protein